MKKHNSIRKPLVRGITRAALVIFMASMCADFTASLAPLVSLIISGAWLYLYAYANGYVYKVVRK